MKIVVKQNKNKIITIEKNEVVTLELLDDNSKVILKTNAFIGKNGLTKDKKEGDKKTPIGTFNLGIAFGTHEKINSKIDYIKINKNLYWVDDVNSKYYNKLVDILNVEKDFKSAEHLCEFPKEYEHGIEIKTNPKNIKGKGSAIFLHCSTGKPTAGCIAINKKYMKKILEIIDKNTIISIY